jgi:hypothetical protein
MPYVPRRLRREPWLAEPGGRVAGSARGARVDRALARFTADSTVRLLMAAIDSPGCRAWERHLVVLWLRVLQRPPHGRVVAGPADLNRLVSVVTRAGQAAPTTFHEADSDPRSLVRFPLYGTRLRLHPGDYLHAPMTLRSYATIAAAIDPVILERRGFSATDALELILRHGDRASSALFDTWPAKSDREPASADLGPVVTERELDAVSEVESSAARDLLETCRHPQRAAAALAWLTRKASRTRVSPIPFEPLLGPVLAIDGARGTVFVPAALTLAAASAATSALADEAGDSVSARNRLQAMTNYRAHGLFNGRSRSYPLASADPDGADVGDDPSAEPASAGARPLKGTAGAVDDQSEVLEKPEVHLGERSAVIAISVLGRGELDVALSWAKWRLAQDVADRYGAGPGDSRPTKVVIYDGPAFSTQIVRDTVLVHVEELAELFADAEGDEALVIGFFDELTQHPGTELVGVPDLLDAWIVWRQFALLAPPDATDLEFVQIGDPHVDLPWLRAAAWEPFEPFLEQADLPPSIGWPYAHLDGQEADLYAPHDGAFALMRLDPPVSVMGAFADIDHFEMPRDALSGLADGVRNTFGRHPDIDSHLRLESGVPVTMLLRLDAEATRPDEPGMRVGLACDPARAIAQISVSPDVMGLFLTDAAQGHFAFGLAIHRAVADLRAERGEALGVEEAAFMAAWRACPPVTDIHVYERYTPELGTPARLPTGKHVSVRVLREIAAEVARRGAPTGTFGAEGAQQVIREHLLPAIGSLLQCRVEACQPKLLEIAVSFLADAHALRHKEQLELSTSLSGPFAANWIEHALNTTDGAEKTRPLEMLVEFIMAHPPTGDRHVDPGVVAELAELAWELLLAASRLRNLESTLQDLTVEVLDGGFTITETAQESTEHELAGLGFDSGSYLDARRAQQIAIAQAAPRPPNAPVGTVLAPARRVTQSFTTLDSVDDEQLVEADRLLQGSWGMGLDAIRAVLAVARTWDVGANRFATTDRATLVAEAVDWSGQPIDAVGKAVDMLVLDGTEMGELETARLVDLDRRIHRIGLRPLLRVRDQIVIAPWLAETTVGIFATYLADGRLPYPTDAVPASVRELLERRRQASNTELEDTVADLARAIGLPHRLRFDQGDAALAGIRGLTGEIDLLVADSVNRRLWVCEVKDPFMAFSPGTVKRRMVKFTRPKGYIAGLLTKAAVIERDADATAAACGAPATTGWRIIPLFVTRWVEPVAFISNPKLAFTVPESLTTVLTAHDDPPLGFAS